MKKPDTITTLQELKELLKKFRDERGWAIYHTPKNVASALSVEAGELLELFAWQNDQQIEKQLKDPTFLQCVKDELADIVMLSLCFSNVLDFDLATLVKEKVKKTELKYPIDEVKGSLTKYLALKTKKNQK